MLLLALALGLGVSDADYGRSDSWLCHPQLNAGGCETDQSTTMVTADGGLKPVGWTPARDPKVDCFYVYPTASHDQGLNSDMTAGPEERLVFATQAARYRSMCRMFAPLYRQQTLAALRARLTGGPAGDPETAYADVRAAWRRYLANDAKGRGVVLIGHSQGARWLQRLIAEEIEGSPAQRRVIAAHLIGFPVAVPRGAVAGGSFKSMPLCTRRDQSGCIIAFSMVRAGTTPSAMSTFGRAASPLKAGCTNPAALGSGKGELHAVMPTRGMALASAGRPHPWLASGEQIGSAFVATPELLFAQCVEREGARFLELTVNADPADPRTDVIDGDVAVGGRVLTDWGLHAVEMSLTLGSLVDLATAQAAAWKRAAR